MRRRGRGVLAASGAVVVSLVLSACGGPSNPDLGAMSVPKILALAAKNLGHEPSARFTLTEGFEGGSLSATITSTKRGDTDATITVSKTSSINGTVDFRTSGTRSAIRIDRTFFTSAIALRSGATIPARYRAAIIDGLAGQWIDPTVVGQTSGFTSLATAISISSFTRSLPALATGSKKLGFRTVAGHRAMAIGATGGSLSISANATPLPIELDLAGNHGVLAVAYPGSVTVTVPTTRSLTELVGPVVAKILAGGL